jgi:hypothetical protein
MVIVLRPGPVADPVQDPTGFDRVTGSAGLVLFLKKLKRRHFSKKKKNKSQRVCNRVAGPTRRVTPSFFFPRFFFNPARFQPRVGPVSKL